MSDTLLIILVCVFAIGGLVSVACILDKRSKQSEPAGYSKPEPGSIAKILLWIARMLIALTILSIIGAFAYRSLFLAQLAGSLLFLNIIDGILYRVVLSVGK